MTDAAVAKKATSLEYYVKLSDAYQALGKAMLPDWVDYQVCINKDGVWKKTNLSPYLRKINRPDKEEILEPINLSTDTRLQYADASEDDIRQHNIVETYLFKPLSVGEIGSKCRVAGSWNDVPQEVWDYQSFEISVIESKATAINGNTIWPLLIEPNSLAEKVKEHNIIKGANKNPRGGRKQELDWQVIEPLLIKLAESKVWKSDAELIKATEDKLKEMKFTSTEIPERTTMRKRLIALRNDSKINWIN